MENKIKTNLHILLRVREAGAHERGAAIASAQVLPLKAARAHKRRMQVEVSAQPGRPHDRLTLLVVGCRQLHGLYNLLGEFATGYYR